MKLTGRHFPLTCIIAILAISFIVCCKRNQGSMRPWQSPIYASDSLMSAIDAEMAGDGRMNVVRPLIKKVDSLAKATGDSQMKARSLYMKARFLRLEDRDSLALEILKKAILLTDTTRYPYDMARFTNLYLKEIFPKDSDRFIRLRKNLEVFKSANDSFRVSEVYNRIGVFYRGAYDYGRAAKYYGKSRQWMNPGQTDILFKLEFNRGLLYKSAENRDSMKAIYKRLLDNPKRKEYPKLNCIILENNYRLFGGGELLREAFSLEMAMDPESSDYYYPTETAALLTQYFRRKQLPDSATFYAHIATAGVGNLKPSAEEVPRILAKYYLYIGMEDSAKYYEEIANGMLNELNEDKAAGKELREKNKDVISYANKLTSERKGTSRPLIWLPIIIILLTTLIYLLFARRYHKKEDL